MSKKRIRDSITQDVLRAFNQMNAATTTTDEIDMERADINDANAIKHRTIDFDVTSNSFPDALIHENDTSMYGSNEDQSSSLNNRGSSKVTFESLITQNSLSSSPKTKDQSVMAQIDLNERVTPTAANTHEKIQEINDNLNGRPATINEGTITSGSTSAKSSVKELVRSPKSTSHRKSKSQNRARKALRTITFILGRLSFSSSHDLEVSDRLRHIFFARISLLSSHWIHRYPADLLYIDAFVFLGAFVVCWTPW